jgi:uncharacterized protein YndB with AHSA1/START domain
MAEYRFSIMVNAPIDRVFDAYTDLDRMSEWVGGVTRVTDVNGPIDRVGTRYTVWFGRMRSPTEVLDVERPIRFRTRFGNLVLKGETDTAFQPEGDRTRLTTVMTPRGLFSAIFARLFATGSYAGSFRGELEAFRRIVEREEGRR